MLLPVTIGRFLSRAVGRLGVDERLDAVAGPVGDAVRTALDREPAKDLLSGTWLGHPLHPLLTDLPIGFWTSAFTLGSFFRSERASTIPARSPGANPVRQANASSGLVSQRTVVIPIGPRNWASIPPAPCWP